MIGWSIELSEYGLVFEPRGPIKSQVLADFATELTPQPKEFARVTWILSVDGSSNSKGSGTGIIIESSTGTMIEQCLKFEFKASNNQAEYEALIAGLRLVIDLSVRHLTIRSDSQLVVSQVNGDYQAKENNMQN